VAQFMLAISVLDELTAETCAAVTGRPDAVALLRSMDAAACSSRRWTMTG
jgi:hypothetical protein